MSELTALKCKTCGNMLDLTTATDGVVECPYCYNKWTVAKKESDPAVLQFLRMGEHDLDTAKFDDAFAAYSKAAELDSSEPEAYFGKALAKFKVQYLKDEVNNRMQPICHSVTTDKFSDDPDFMRACLKATSSQRAEYEKRAKDIDYIQSEFAKLEKSGVDYNCFICVKVTDDNTKLRTSDYKTADDIYFALRGKNYKPFFSERELEGVTGADYEARILYALKKSECMLVVCSDEEYLKTKWVKNEYTRFLKLVNDEEKESDSIAVAFKGKPIERLPGKNGKLQGIDLNKLGALSRVEEFVEAHTPESRARAEAAKAAKAKEEEEQKAALAEQKRLLEEQQKRINEQLEKLKNISSGTVKADGLTDEELLERMERARVEKERKAREEAERIAREKAEAERIAREEAERIAREKAEAERIAREEAERKKVEEAKRWEWMRENEPTLDLYIKSDFEIDGTVLKKYTGKKANVKVPRGVTSISEDAFQDYINLTSIIIPDSVTTICEDVFDYCENLESITVDENNTKYSSQEGILYNKDKTEIIIVPQAKTSITIPDSVTSIDGSAFWGCTSLDNITVDENNSKYLSQEGILYNKDKTEIIRVPQTKTNITIPDSVTSIGYCAFEDCTNLESVTIPDSVTSIDNRAFNGCTSLESVTIGNGVTSIGDSAFYGCESLTSITIPNSVKSIGGGAFGDCTSLESVIMGNGVTSIGMCAFVDCTSLESVIIPDSVTSVGTGAFYKCEIKTVTLPALAIKEIPRDDLQTVVITSGDSIDSRAFYGCENLTIYCRAAKRPKGWDKEWDLVKEGNIFTAKRAKVVWDYKG